MLTKLNELSVVLGTIDEVNEGGCCSVAAIVGQKIAPHVTHLKVLVLSQADRRLDEARADAAFNGADPTDPLALIDIGKLHISHLVLEFRVDGDWYYYDITTGVQTNIGEVYAWYDFEYDTVGEITVEEAASWAENADAWNDAFDRNSIVDIQHWTDTILEQAA